MVIREERSADQAAITSVTMAAFQDHPVSRQTEHFIVDALRASGALSLSLVAEVDGQVVGHAAFSPVSISDGTADWFGVGPVSVWPAWQRQGVGTKLMEAGVALLKERGARGCALVGPPDYYRRFGFANRPELIHKGIPQEFFLVLPLAEPVPSGTVVFHAGFAATS